MAYIFLDESGDLGFDWSKKKTSKYFVITAMFVNDKNPVENIVKKIFKTMSKHDLKHHDDILHSYKEKPKTRIRLLNLLLKQDVSILTIYLNKKKVYTNLRNEKHVLYNYVTNILLDRIYTRKLIHITGEIFLVAATRETNRFLNDNFKNYLENQVENKHKSKLKVWIKYPYEEKSLQIVDFASWAIFRKWEHADESYYEIIKSLVIEENPLFA